MHIIGWLLLNAIHIQHEVSPYVDSQCNDMSEAYKLKWSLHKNLSCDTKNGKHDKQISHEGKWGWEQIIM